jgi:hypothetical protein
VRFSPLYVDYAQMDNNYSQDRIAAPHEQQEEFQGREQCTAGAEFASQGRHMCQRTDDQQYHVERSRVSLPRPHIGVDEQGNLFGDWEGLSFDNPYVEAAAKEKAVMWHLNLDIIDPNNDDPDTVVLPAPVRPRRPRVFSQQFLLQFRHIPENAFDVLECWHMQYGRCLDCIIKAMRTFPSWVSEMTSAGMENGNPVFVNSNQDELVEWDEERNRWRHLILDHYRWVPVDEVEERPSDSTANPKIANGTTGGRVPVYVPYIRIK